MAFQLIKAASLSCPPGRKSGEGQKDQYSDFILFSPSSVLPAPFTDEHQLEGRRPGYLLIASLLVNLEHRAGLRIDVEAQTRDILHRFPRPQDSVAITHFIAYFGISRPCAPELL